jgi:hypothetical protein
LRRSRSGRSISMSIHVQSSCHGTDARAVNELGIPDRPGAGGVFESEKRLSEIENKE